MLAPSHPLLRRADAGILALVVVLALLTAGGLLGGWHWVLDLTASVRHVYAVAAVLAGAVLLARRQLAGVALAVAVAGVNAAFVVPLWVGTPGGPETGAATLTVASHNVHAGGLGRAREAVEALAPHGPDLIFLYAVDRFADEDLTQPGSPYREHHPSAELHGGVVVLSRVPVAEVEAVPLGAQVEADALEVQVELGGQPVSVLGVRTTSPRTAERAAQRDRQLADVAAWARDQRGPAVVVGDLNVTVWNDAFRRLLAAGGLRDSQRGFGIQPSWPASSSRLARVVELPHPLRLPIDHALHSPDLVTVARRLGPAVGSTHRSLLVELAPAGPDEAPR